MARTYARTASAVCQACQPGTAAGSRLKPSRNYQPTNQPNPRKRDFECMPWSNEVREFIKKLRKMEESLS